MDAQCSIAECTNTIYVKKWQLCGVHYERRRVRPQATKPTRDELMAGSSRNTETGCLVWMGACTHSNPRYKYPKFRGYLLHRLMFELHTGIKLKSTDFVDHMCHNTMCIEPAHLRQATPAENAQNLVRARNNTSGMRGVSFKQRTQRWEAKAQKAGVSYFAGQYKSFEEACNAVVALRARLYSHVIEEFSTA